MVIDFLSRTVGSKWLTFITTLLSLLVGLLTGITYFVKEAENTKKDVELKRIQESNINATKEVKLLTEKSGKLQEEKFELLEEYHKRHSEESEQLKSDIQDVDKPRITVVPIGFEDGVFKYGLKNDDNRTFNKVSMGFRTTIKVFNGHTQIHLEQTKNLVNSTSILDKPFKPGDIFVSRTRLYNVSENDELWVTSDQIQFATDVSFTLDEYRSTNSSPERSVFFKVIIHRGKTGKPTVGYTSNRHEFKKHYW